MVAAFGKTTLGLIYSLVRGVMYGWVHSWGWGTQAGTGRVWMQPGQLHEVKTMLRLAWSVCGLTFVSVRMGFGGCCVPGWERGGISTERYER
jgi:hypothetical protein